MGIENIFQFLFVAKNSEMQCRKEDRRITAETDLQYEDYQNIKWKEFLEMTGKTLAAIAAAIIAIIGEIEGDD